MAKTLGMGFMGSMYPFRNAKCSSPVHNEFTMNNNVVCESTRGRERETEREREREREMKREREREREREPSVVHPSVCHLSSPYAQIDVSQSRRGGGGGTGECVCVSDLV